MLPQHYELCGVVCILLTRLALPERGSFSCAPGTLRVEYHPLAGVGNLFADAWHKRQASGGKMGEQAEGWQPSSDLLLQGSPCYGGIKRLHCQKNP